MHEYWEELKLGDIAEIQMGQSPLGKTVYKEEKGLPLLNGPAEFGVYSPHALQYTTDPKRFSNNNDILFCVRGSTTGRMNWSDQTYAIGRGLAAIRHREGDQYRFFIKAILDYHLNDLLSGATGSTFPNVSRDQLNNLNIRCPSLIKQLKISNILSSLDNKIALNRRQNETLEAIAQAIFKDWFVDFGPARAKIEGREAYLPGEIWQLFPDRLDEDGKPEGWKNTSLDHFSYLNPEAWNKKTIPSHIRYVDLSGTKWGYIEAVTDYTSEDAPSRARRVLRPNDTILGTVRPGNGAYALISDNGLTGSTGFAVLRPIKEEYTSIIYLAVSSSENIKRLANLADGGAYPAVGAKLISATSIMFGGDEIIEAFHRITFPFLQKISINNNGSRALAQLRDTLLPKLISGELRIPDAEQVIEESI
ncbi:restriction endonuclease subunit S [Carnimonas bestiolae]|uniref:restriction endonuclease subunit S n=1 Tax=Carnimonas bestiolae TaxID=3402172 RepID=UPI003EDBC9D9